MISKTYVDQPSLSLSRARVHGDDDLEDLIRTLLPLSPATARTYMQKSHPYTAPEVDLRQQRLSKDIQELGDSESEEEPAREEESEEEEDEGESVARAPGQTRRRRRRRGTPQPRGRQWKYVPIELPLVTLKALFV